VVSSTYCGIFTQFQLAVGVNEKVRGILFLQTKMPFQTT
jgi:hypothetical protein